MLELAQKWLDVVAGPGKLMSQVQKAGQLMTGSGDYEPARKSLSALLCAGASERWQVGSDTLSECPLIDEGDVVVDVRTRVTIRMWREMNQLLEALSSSASSFLEKGPPSSAFLPSLPVMPTTWAPADQSPLATHVSHEATLMPIGHQLQVSASHTRPELDCDSKHVNHVQSVNLTK